jgi:hypothetical protein
MPSTLQNLIIIITLMVVGTTLVLGLWNMMKGGSPSHSQNLMRLRVLLQTIAIVIVLITIWALGH